jgi:hypothetical protein
MLIKDKGGKDVPQAGCNGMQVGAPGETVM